MGRGVVVEIGRVGGETIVAEDAIGDVAVGEVDPLTDLLRGVHQPGSVLSPDTESAGDSAGVEVRGLSQYVAVEEALRISVGGGGDDGHIRERGEA